MIIEQVNVCKDELRSLSDTKPFQKFPDNLTSVKRQKISYNNSG